MNYRYIGKSNIKVSEIGFGAWGIGGSKNGSISYGSTKDDESLLALNTAYDQGITFYDTSDFYGFGHSEELIGKAFCNKRNHIFIATKGRMVSVQQKDFTISNIERSILGSLIRLKTEFLDLYQLHNPSQISNQLDDTIGFLLKTKEQGKIRFIGISANTPLEAIEFINRYTLDFIQVNFNLMHQRPIKTGLFEIRQKKNVSLIDRTPLGFGFLSGRIKNINDFPENDHRNNWDKEQLEVWLHAIEKFPFLYADIHPNQYSDVALTYCLSYEEVTVVIPGILSADEAILNAKVSDRKKYLKETLLKIEDVYNKTNFFIKK